ncbi:MAG: prephenate dehydrogenase/arogenate dehydrogenase family protein [Ignavibacteriaceae bacterium]|nr:prephenate dehydrogenase/arogenate dehydrogenase family protein [Ignavibacteriaceae bacterium]
MSIRISIIGLGLIGGSLAKGFKRANKDIYISAFDKDDVLLKALEEEIIDEKLESFEESLKNKIVFICLPVELSLDVFKKLIPLMNDENILTDVCSVKKVFSDFWKNNHRKGCYIGGHPMTGKEKGGYQNSDPLLFENSVYILTDETDSSLKNQELVSLIELLGCRITILESSLHDRIIARVSHIPQLLAVALVNSSSKEERGRKFTSFGAGGFRDMTRIASSDFGLWKSIFKYNKEEILIGFSELISTIEKTKEYLSKDNFEFLEKQFSTAHLLRDEIPKDSKGFISPLFDLFISVKDEPGVISKISTELYLNNINIKDIELLKIREGDGGTFRLSFESEEAVNRAANLLNALGFQTRIV